MKRYSLVMVTLFLLIGQLFFTANVDAATSNSVNTQAGGQQCGSINGIIIDFNSEEIRADRVPEDAQTAPVQTSISPGTYAITLTSFDDHDVHPAPDQTLEEWHVRFRSGDRVVVNSGTISDLPDEQNYLTEQVNDRLVISEPIDNIIAHHSHYPPQHTIAHSVYPVCIALTPIVEVASIGDYVWHDINQNGLQDDGEPGIANVPVHLLNGSGQLVASTNTDGNGRYLFAQLTPGDYAIKVDVPAGMIVTNAHKGDDNIDSDIDTNGYMPVTNLQEGENDMSWDAGLYMPPPPPPPTPTTASIGNRVWLDTNQDGMQSAGEAGVANVTVILMNNSGMELAYATTNAEGFYQFADLQPNDYQLKFIAPDGYQLTSLDMSNNDEMDSDANPANGRTIVTSLDANEHDMSWDAGLFMEAPPQETACTRFNLDLGRNALTGAGVEGRYEMIEVGTGRLLASWDADFWWADSGWIEGIELSFPDGSWVEVYFYPNGAAPAQKLEVINPAPGTEYGWVAPGMCHAVEIEFPVDWAYTNPPAEEPAAQPTTTTQTTTTTQATEPTVAEEPVINLKSVSFRISLERAELGFVIL